MTGQSQRRQRRRNIPVELQSRIEVVTVYAEGAVVRRMATGLIRPKGIPLVVRTPGLPLTLRPTSLRASVVAGPEALRVLDVRSSAVEAAAPYWRSNAASEATRVASANGEHCGASSSERSHAAARDEVRPEPGGQPRSRSPPRGD